MSDKDLPKDEDAPSAKSDSPEAGPEGTDNALEAAFFDEEKVAAIKAELEAEGAGGDLDADLEGLDEAVDGDDELARIMAPKRAVRHPIVASVVILASLVGMYWFWEDFRFWLHDSEPEQIGSASKAVNEGRLKANTYVTLRGQAVPQTMANGKDTSLLGAASKRKIYMFVLKDTGNRVVVRSHKPLITNRHKPGPHKFRAGIFTGRLRRLDATKYSADLRHFYKKRSRQSKALQREHQLTAAAVLQGAGKPRVKIKDVRGEGVVVKQDTQLALFVTFPGDYEFKVHTGVEDPLKGISVTAGTGAKECGQPDPKTGLPPTGRGGSVYVKLDPKSVGLDPVAKLMTFTAGDAQPGAKPGEAPDDGKDVVIAVPPGTEVYNAAVRDCAKVCLHVGAVASKACQKSCSKKKGVQITPDSDGRVLVAVGGRCGGFAGEKHRINLQGKPYETAKRAEALVASLGHPYVMVEDASKTPRKAVNFVLRLPTAEAKRILKQQSRHSPYNISPRYDVFYVKWRNLIRQGPNLVINRTHRGYPRQYTVKTTKAGKRLVAEPLGASLSLAPSRVEKAELSQLLQLPKDTFVLEEGVKPSSMWSEPFMPGVPIFYLLMVAFILLNLLAIRAYFRG